MPDPICSTCHQPIRADEGHRWRPDGKQYHYEAANCVAAAVRRFVEITKGRSEFQHRAYRFPDEIVAAIRAEFPEAKL
jgi:hypothetical protein